MTGLTMSPRVQKGALVGLDAANPLASVIAFQYNPESLTRTLTPQTAGAAAGGNAPADALRLAGPPQEVIRLEVTIDATDRLERGDAADGIHPELAQLEMLIYPKSALVIANEALLLAGVVEVIPPEAPLAILVWGAKRVVPVRVVDFSITEQDFDPELNPIRAKVTLGLRVLNYRDLGLMSAGGGLFMAHQVVKEALATSRSSDQAAALLARIGV